ncbi:tRNA pseudouridine(38-40) synthase TruA [Serpentinicella sp. ANB-PHB4]|uniref:tRNA pseudouridine(38-40) synthase TruA n=1 Tax=Serpentinicella sp. ANB-PHB4 TaxID=3074076 RepID=UPI0028577141|nr:tRNA pseudouridine(38-40) synthase TruA [Serpentinicella sp. ANB-PHB4]MDR5659518.1 tRNA pseudouridine(38-40) synthase TruA [Serpentinicella sp. ANB-PHB4]
MRNIMVEIEYDGTNYSGWQIQQNANTVQAEVLKAIKKITNQEVKMHASGRTDAGVHAKGQVANFYMDYPIPVEGFKKVINKFLPNDIAILNVKEVPLTFHARYNVVSKRYIYKIYNNTTRSPLMFNYSYHVSPKINIDIIKEGTRILEGTHDFKSFVTSGSTAKNTVRTIYNIQVEQVGNMIILSFHGNGFLYNMVRNIVGTLVEMSIGKKDIKQLEKILNMKDRKAAGHKAPPQGLFLDKVFY